MMDFMHNTSSPVPLARRSSRLSFVSGLSLVSFCLLGATAACSPDDGEEPMGGSGGGMASGGGTASGGEAASGGGGTTDPTQMPSDTSQAGIEAFITAGTYKNWVHDPAPRGVSAILTTHGGWMQVYFNDVAAAAGSQGQPDAGAMIVKELYDMTSGAQIGTAVNIKLEGEKNWVFYCSSTPEEACQATEASPVYGTTDSNVSCSSCHGNTVLSPLPN